jgi:hypothetical protein
MIESHVRTARKAAMHGFGKSTSFTRAIKRLKISPRFSA